MWEEEEGEEEGDSTPQHKSKAGPLLLCFFKVEGAEFVVSFVDDVITLEKLFTVKVLLSMTTCLVTTQVSCSSCCNHDFFW